MLPYGEIKCFFFNLQVPVEVLDLLSTNKNGLNLLLYHHSSSVVPKKRSENKHEGKECDLVRDPSIQHVSVKLLAFWGGDKKTF